MAGLSLLGSHPKAAYRLVTKRLRAAVQQKVIVLIRANNQIPRRFIIARIAIDVMHYGLWRFVYPAGH